MAAKRQRLQLAVQPTARLQRGPSRPLVKVAAAVAHAGTLPVRHHLETP